MRIFQRPQHGLALEIAHGVALRVLIQKFRNLGFEGPFSGGKHAFMCRENLKVRIPNEHGDDIGVSLLGEILRHAGVTDADWENA